MIQIITNEAEWDRLQADWHSLHDSSPHSAAPLAWQWMRSWWDIYRPAGAELRLVTVRDKDRLVGVLPLYSVPYALPMVGLRGRRLRFLSTGEQIRDQTCPDYMDLLHAPGQEDACLAGLREFMARPGWDELTLERVSERSPLWRLRDFLPRGYRVETIPGGTCPVADLGGGMEEYFRRLPSSRRQQFRRLLRLAERKGAILEEANHPEQVREFFEQLIQLHQARWQSSGQPGCFASPRFLQFHRQLAHSWVPEGKAFLARVAIDGRPASVSYGFVRGSKYDYYQSGRLVEEPTPFPSPGIVAHLMAMRRLAERGITAYDFLAGNRLYKHRLSTDARPLATLRILQPTLRGTLHHWLDEVRRVGKRLRSKWRTQWADNQIRAVQDTAVPTGSAYELSTSPEPSTSHELSNSHG